MSETSDRVTGRTATPGECCNTCGIHIDAVSTFLLDGKKFASACERHIIATYDRAVAVAGAPIYQRGTKTGRVNMTHVQNGARILVDGTGHLILAQAKTGAKIATVKGKKHGGWRCYTLITDLGEVTAAAAQCMHVL